MIVVGALVSALLAHSVKPLAPLSDKSLDSATPNFVRSSLSSPLLPVVALWFFASMFSSSYLIMPSFL